MPGTMLSSENINMKTHSFLWGLMNAIPEYSENQSTQLQLVCVS